MKPAKLSDASSKYGAPMGRSDTVHPGDADEAASIELQRVELDEGGYDDGGAYWGVGQPLYLALITVDGEQGSLFFRANSPAAARTHVMRLYPNATIES
jgi:hypothetical protein